jgi:prepilin peptidase CpaA
MADEIWQYQPPVVMWVAVLAAAGVATIWDLRTRRVPNWLTGPLFVTGLVVAVLSGGVAGVVSATIAALLLAGPYVVLFILARGGAGDAKLMGAAGACLGLQHGVVALLAVALAGVVLGAVYAAQCRRLSETFSNLRGIAAVGVLWRMRAIDFAETKSRLPGHAETLPMSYGIAILVGLLIAAGVAIL